MKAFCFIVFIFVSPFFIKAQEICDNGIDDDADGLIDLLDTTECSCDTLSFSLLSALIPNPSFEDTLCCPNASGQLSCALNWQQASIATSDYYNLCGFDSLDPINLVDSRPLPLPHGNGFAGFYNIAGVFPGGGVKEYIGVCLTNPMIAGKSYTLSFYMAQGAGRLTVPISLFGTSNCGNIPFGGNNFLFGCPTNGVGWQELKTDTFTVSNSFWTQVSLTFTPTQTINGIVIGPDCDSSTFTNDYHYIDNFSLTESSSFSGIINLNSGHYCQNNLILRVDYDSVPKAIQWYKNGIALVNDTSKLYQVPPSGAGYYQVLLTYDSGCTVSPKFYVDSVTISYKLDLKSSCLDTLINGEAHLSGISGGTAPYQFSLDNFPFSLDSSFTKVHPGPHSIMVRDSNLCAQIVFFTLDTFSSPTPSFTADTVCFGNATTLQDNSFILSGNIVGWEWSVSGNPTTSIVNHTFQSDGIFPIKLTVVSDSGCVQDTTVNVVVRENPTANFLSNPTTVFLYDTKVCFTNLSSNGNSYHWDFGFAGMNGSSILENPCNVLFPDQSSNNYLVKLLVTNIFGCEDSIVKTIIIENGYNLFIPNSFSPNGDGVNDIFHVIGQGIEGLQFRIFNRWGELIFSTSDFSQGWDGKYLNLEAPMDIYVYYIRYKDFAGEVNEKIGHITLVK